ncbi:MAG: hypothetical protein A3I00_07745 [Betaproteobacteria bacterium RIFCSPLOWO2_02_FULL_64_12]|nr:MAG: hypothetical protein A3I00_07745 [Betaproteobacteria bacterium RIFCSPLOWO2_02_FULL_64_12]
MDRDRTSDFSWADLSPIAEDLRERVVRMKLGQPKAFDEALERARPALEKVGRLGGDPRFALAVLVSARWRRLRSPGKRFPRWIRDLERLASDEELAQLLQGSREPRGQLKAAVDDALRHLRSLVWMDDSVFESSSTRRTEETHRWTSRHTDAALAILAWHLRTGTRARQMNAVLLAELADAFNLIRTRGGEPPPVEAVEQRLKRIKGDYYEKFAIPRYRRTFHDQHRFLASKSGDAALKRCGTACPENPPPDWWREPGPRDGD